MGNYLLSVLQRQKKVFFETLHSGDDYGPSMPNSFPLSHFPAETLSSISEYLSLPEIYRLLTSGDRNLICRLKSESGVRCVRFTVPQKGDPLRYISYVKSRLPNVKEFLIRGKGYCFYEDKESSPTGATTLTSLIYYTTRIRGYFFYCKPLPYEYSIKNGLVEKMEITGLPRFKIPSSLTHLSLTIDCEIEQMDLDELTRAAPNLAVFKIPNSGALFLCQNRPILPHLQVFEVHPEASFSTDVSSTEDLTEDLFSFLPSGLECFSHPKVIEVGHKFPWWSNLKHLSIGVVGQDKLVLPPKITSLELSSVDGHRQLPEMSFPSTLRRLRILNLDTPEPFVESLPKSLIYLEF